MPGRTHAKHSQATRIWTELAAQPLQMGVKEGLRLAAQRGAVADILSRLQRCHAKLRGGGPQPALANGSNPAGAAAEPRRGGLERHAGRTKRPALREPRAQKRADERWLSRFRASDPDDGFVARLGDGLFAPKALVVEELFERIELDPLKRGALAMDDRKAISELRVPVLDTQIEKALESEFRVNISRTDLSAFRMESPDTVRAGHMIKECVRHEFLGRPAKARLAGGAGEIVRSECVLMQSEADTGDRHRYASSDYLLHGLAAEGTAAAIMDEAARVIAKNHSVHPLIKRRILAKIHSVVSAE